MAKVIISGDAAPTIVNDEIGRQIRDKKNDPKHKGMIDLPGGRSLPKSRIREVILGDEQKPAQAYDLDNIEDVARLEGVEAEMNRVAAEAIPRPLEWYGMPHGDFVERHPQIPPKEGWVFNQMLGLVPWHWVEFAMRQGAISKIGEAWCVKGTPIEGTKRIDVSSFSFVSGTFKALREREARKEFAERQATGQSQPFHRYETPANIGAMPEAKVETEAPATFDEPEPEDEIPF